MLKDKVIQCKNKLRKSFSNFFLANFQQKLFKSFLAGTTLQVYIHVFAEQKDFSWKRLEIYFYANISLRKTANNSAWSECTLFFFNWKIILLGILSHVCMAKILENLLCKAIFTLIVMSWLFLEC